MLFIHSWRIKKTLSLNKERARIKPAAIASAALSMFKVAHIGHGHGDTVFIARFNHFVVAD